MLLTSGVLEALRRALPEAHIIYVTKAAMAPVIRSHPAIDELLLLEKGESSSSLRRRLKALQPDAILDLHGKLRSRALRTLVPASRRAVWHKRDFTEALVVRLRLRPYRVTKTIAARYHEALEELLGESLEAGHLFFQPEEEALQKARARLEEGGIDFSAGPVVGFSPGAMWETKRWPAEYFIELAQKAMAEGAQVFLTGSPAEAALCGQIARGAPGVVDLAAKMNVPEFSASISLCHAFVANDSGPMHLARAQGVPTLALFGSTAPAQFDFTGHELLWADVDCAPCSLYGLSKCPRGDFRCMRDLNPERAFSALQKLLERGSLDLVRA